MDSRARTQAGPQTTSSAPRQETSENTSGLKSLLAIDDDPTAAELIVKLANRCGYVGRSLSSTRNIRQVLKEWQPDVLTLDLCMPEEDGFQVLSVLQQVGYKGQVIIISGKGEWLRKAACELAEIKDVNVVTHMQKPINVQAFRDLLKSLQPAP
jgi:CheY-like chemotaxis protein